MFQAILGDNWGDNLDSYSANLGSVAYIYFIAFYTLAVFIVLNIVTGVIIGSIMDDDSNDDEDVHPLNRVFSVVKAYLTCKSTDEKQKAVQNVASMFKVDKDAKEDKMEKVIALLNEILANQKNTKAS